MFDRNRPEWTTERAELAGLLDDVERAAAARSTINAHYTSAEVITAIWAAVQELGFDGGRILEPGIGSGNFLALRPANIDASTFTGIELDPTTAAVAAALYPNADIRAESFADSRLPEDSFDLTIGNVPFANVSLHDRLHNRAGHSIHNHFIIKALHLTRPGGVVAVLTSRYTLDARNPAARREMAALADLVGAVRLPGGAMAAAAGTDAICDLVILRRRPPGTPPIREAGLECLACRAGICETVHPGETWEHAVSIDTDSGPVEINELFARHRHLVLGEIGSGRAQYRDRDLVVTAHPAPLGTQLAATLQSLTAAAAAAGGGWTTAPPRSNPALETPRPPPEGDRQLKEGSIIATGTGAFARITAGIPVPFAPSPKSGRAELRALIDIRDALTATLAAQTASSDDTNYSFAQHRLGRAYDAYLERFGPLNRFKLARTGRSDPETGDEINRRTYPPMGGFRSDPDFYSVLALEIFDPETQTARKAAVFSRRVVGPRLPVLGADSPAGALAVCLDQTGRADLATIAALLGIEADQARAELGDLVYEDPTSGGLVPAPRYLSGDVRSKLDAALEAAGRDDRFVGNVDALRQVLPPDLGPDEISARLGVGWIDATDVADFVREVLGTDKAVVEHSPMTAMWAVTAPTWQRNTVTMTSEWGTKRADAIRLISDSLEQRPVKVYDTLDDGRRVLNSDATLAAREKQEALEARFAEWVWEDPQRKVRLLERYNRLFNSLVPTRYDGSHLSLPGLAENFTPHQHQRDAVWRIICEPTCLLGHAVGAGKTATMVMAGMEMRRLGLIKQPAYVVPNHMLEQFTGELLQLYPQARVLVADRNSVTPAARKHFVGRCATGEWDAVILTHSSFERIPISPAAERAYIDTETEQLRQAIDASNAGSGLTVKRLEKLLARAEERQKRLLDVERDDGVSFEECGIDYLFVDEAHAFKRLTFATHIEGISGAGSQRASDMHMKLEVLRDRHGPKVVTFATGTFVTNTIAEMRTMQRYLQPGDLDAAGLSSFDAWAATFGRTVTGLELAPDGGSYRIHTRFAKFVNVPELLTLFSQVADVRTAEQLNLPVPAVAGDGPQTVIVSASAGLEDYVRDLVERAEQIRSRAVRPEEDNMLKVTGDGRKAALDLRLVGLDPDPDGGKIAAAADRIAAIAAATRHNLYLDTDDETHPRPGALQLVFCDISTPADRWNAYDELRAQLVARGLPAEQIRFIHEANSDKAKADLFAACRDGRVAVLVGSSEKMGVGTNVQARAVALHHLDCPWRPADIEQREGRVLRQGNQNPQVEIIRYATEGSFDVYMWQTVERKAAFIHQVARGDIDSREIDDIGDQALSFAQVKALATGNPLIMERAGVEQDLSKLTRLAAAHQREQHDLATRQRSAEERAARVDQQATHVEAALPRRQDTHADLFAMTVDGDRYTGRADAGLALRATLLRLLDRRQPQPGAAESGTTIHRVGELGGFRVEAEISRHPEMGSYGDLRIENLPIRRYPLDRADLGKADPVGLISKLEHRIFDLDETVLALRSQAEQARSEAVAARARLGRPFEHQDRLQTLRSRLIEIDQALTPETEATVTANNPGEAPTTTHPGSISDASVVAFPQSRPASIEA